MRQAADGPAALRLARGGADVLILDLGLPVVDGFEIVRTLRREGRELPILVLTARTEEIDRIVGLEIGADDYVVKPFSPREIVARVKALGRRAGLSSTQAPVVLRFERLEIDEGAREARVDGVDLGLKPREFALLLELASNAGVALSRAVAAGARLGLRLRGRCADRRRPRAARTREARRPRRAGYAGADDARVRVQVCTRLTCAGCCRGSTRSRGGWPSSRTSRARCSSCASPSSSGLRGGAGLRAARAVERTAAAAFSTAVSRVLRGGDLVAHDGGSDVFVAALVAPTRDGSVPAPVDARSALARIAATMEAVTRLEVRTGWTTYEHADAESIAALVERALARGAQERERYAFFCSLGHELRTPLSSIRGYLETLLDEGVDDGTRERFVRIAYNESLRLSRLVEGMFEISLLDLHAAIPAPASGSLVHALDAARDACSGSAAARGVSIAFDEVPALRVAIDADRLTLVLVNLIDNAVKHGRPGGGVFVGIHLDDPRVVQITVDDDGPGIASGDRERVFVFGDRGETDANGTGIGLALVRLMIERAGGRVDLETSPLGGARFILVVPRA